ncbi:MAG: universal stress protein [Sulfolobaceae archaeon]
MMFKHILVAYDGSEYSKKALNVAIDLAKRYGAKLDIIEVIDTAALLSLGIAPIPDNVLRSIQDKVKADIEEAEKKAREAGVEAKGLVVEGEPAASIIEYALKNNVDLIVTGSRGLSTIKRIFLGSVSTKILNESKVPVLVVK